MHNIIEDEFKTFKEDITNETYNFGRYLDESDYEDEYSHNEIDEAKSVLISKIRDYLKEYRPSEFIVSDGWCVFVMTPERAKKSKMSERTIECFLVR